MKKLVPKKKPGIPDINKIRVQYLSGFSINQLSQYWGIPYATLYRSLKKSSKVGEKPTKH